MESSQDRRDVTVDLLTAGPVAFDPERALWLITRYPDVVEAFACRALGVSGGSDPAARAALARVAAGHRVPSPDRLRALWKPRLGILGAVREIDGMADVARPWSRALVAHLTGMAVDDVLAREPLAAAVFAAAARATHPRPTAAHRQAVSELARALPADVEPQAFVALTQSLPALLATAWWHLIRDRDLWSRVGSDASRHPDRVDALLRVGSPVEVLFRTATADVTIAGTRIPEGAVVALGIGAAHRDPGAPEADEEHGGTAGDGASLTLGRGRHGCPGATLIRTSLRVATTLFVEAFPHAMPADAARYGGGFALRYVANLPVSVGRTQAPTTTCTGR